MFNKRTIAFANLLIWFQIGLLAQVPIAKPALLPESNPSPPAVAPSVPPDEVVLTAGSIKLTAAQFDAIIDTIPEQYRAAARSTGRKPMAENIARVLVLAQEGKRLKVDESSAFKAQEEFQTMNHLAGTAFTEITNHAQVDEARLRAYYEQHKAEFEQVHARHILVRVTGSVAPIKPSQKDLSEDEALAKAQQLRKQLLAGADFATLASTESDDPGSAARGGELDVFGHGQMVPVFDQAAFALQPGVISEPVRTPFGYHLIRVEAKEPKPFEELRPELERRVRPQVAQEIVDGLQKKATVTFDPNFFGPPVKETAEVNGNKR
jgi:parvulin-like peptidyl-prolyl isomerase